MRIVSPTVKAVAETPPTPCSGFASFHYNAHILPLKTVQLYMTPPPLCTKIKTNIQTSWVLWSFYAAMSLMMTRSTVLGKFFRRDTAFPWSMLTKLYPFTCDRDETRELTAFILKEQRKLKEMAGRGKHEEVKRRRYLDDLVSWLEEFRSRSVSLNSCHKYPLLKQTVLIINHQRGLSESGPKQKK